MHMLYKRYAYSCNVLALFRVIFRSATTFMMYCEWVCVICADKRHSVRLGVKKSLLDRRWVQLHRCYMDRGLRILETNRHYRPQLTAGYRCRSYTCV